MPKLNHPHQQNHQSMDDLLNLFTQANHDLFLVQHKIETEFRQKYPDKANPMKLVTRIKKIQEDASMLEEQCRELLSAKQNLIDMARATLVGNRRLLQRMQGSLGIPSTSDSDDPEFANFNQVIDEWTNQVRSGIGAEKHDSDSEDVNKLLFSAIVQSN